MSLRIQVSDLLARPGHARSEQGTFEADIDLETAVVRGEATVVLELRSLTDGVVVHGTVEALAELTCNRCLTEWQEPVQLSFSQVFRLVPEDEETELAIEKGTWIDLEPACRDELALALPLVSLCRPDCMGLCPTCGTDLNTGACAGHTEGVTSPFAALADLLKP